MPYLMKKDREREIRAADRCASVVIVGPKGLERCDGRNRRSLGAYFWTGGRRE